MATAVLLWLITLWRAPGAWRNPQKRPLWSAFAILATEMLLSSDSAILWFDSATGINSGSALVKHMCAVVAAGCVVAFLAGAVASSTGEKDRPDGRASRYAHARTVIPAVTVLVMAVLFAWMERPREEIDLFVAYPRDSWVLAYNITWITYFGWAMLTAARLSWQWSRRPGPPLLRYGLTLICAGTSIGIVYAAHRLSMLLIPRLGLHPLPAGVNHTLNVFLAVVPLLLIAVGSTMPAVPKLHQALAHHYDHVLLYSLWDTLTSTAPHVRLEEHPGRLRDMLALLAPRERLYRRTIEIRDAILVLGDNTTLSVRLRAADHVEDAGIPESELVTAAEACWIRAASEARKAGHFVAGTLEPPERAGGDLDTEVRVLRTLSDAYFSPVTADFARQHVARLTSPGASPVATFSPPAPPAWPDCTRTQKAARLFTEALAPANLVIVLLLLIGWHSTMTWSGLGWGLVAALFCGVIPISIVLLGVKRGELTDKHIRVRRQRMVPMTLSLLSVVAGIVLLYLLGAPKDVSALVVAMLVGLASSLAVTVWWQISIHNSVAGGTVMILLLAFGLPMLPAVLAAVAIGWSRLVLKAHTLPQVLAGTALGGTAALAFVLLR